MAKIISDFDYEIKIDFEKGSGNPARVFTVMSNLIHAFEMVDVDLAQSIDINIKPTLLLEDIRAGSLRSFLRSSLLAIDDNGLIELNWRKLVGNYLYKGKYILLRFLEDKNEISNLNDIAELKTQILFAANETNVRHLPGYAELPTNKLLESIRNVTQSLQSLESGDHVEYRTADGIVKMNKEFIYNQEKIEDLLTSKILKSKTEETLKIKKPDYLGQSMWEFKLDDRSIQAKIIDQQWLYNFQARLYDLRPGDSIRVLMETAQHVGFKNEVLATHYYIHEIKDIIPMQHNNGVDIIFPD